MDETEAVALDRELAQDLHRVWLTLIDTAVWGDLKSEQIGALGKLRKRILELGERLKSLDADRTWIPQRRERIKNFLGSCLNMRETLLLVERAAQGLTGGTDAAAFVAALDELRATAASRLQEQENAWANALQTLNRDALADEDET